MIFQNSRKLFKTYEFFTNHQSSCKSCSIFQYMFFPQKNIDLEGKCLDINQPENSVCKRYTCQLYSVHQFI